MEGHHDEEKRAAAMKKGNLMSLAFQNAPKQIKKMNLKENVKGVNDVNDGQIMMGVDMAKKRGGVEIDGL